MAMVLGLGAAMSATSLGDKEVHHATEIEHDETKNGSFWGTVQYFNHRKQCPKKAKAFWRNKYYDPRSRSVAFLDTATVPPIPIYHKFDNSDDARRKKRETRAIAVKERHERRRNGIQYA